LATATVIVAATAVVTPTAPAASTPQGVATREPTSVTNRTLVGAPSGSGFAASVASLAFPVAAYSHGARLQTGVLVVTADDSAGFLDGWNVTLQASAFSYAGVNHGADIPAANLALSSVSAPVMTAGQPIDGTNGPRVPTTSPVGTLDTARKLLQASPAYGQGIYLQNLGVSFTIPAMARAGVYTGVLTTTISSAP
jgi:hypothetical protein